MTENELNLKGKICPFPVMHIVREVEMMRCGETLKFIVDDPLAIKSVPEELEDSPGLSVTISKAGRSWEIVVVKN
jgi:tRNA 2-thiouridine synthesizing protein A